MNVKPISKKLRRIIEVISVLGMIFLTAASCDPWKFTMSINRPVNNPEPGEVFTYGVTVRAESEEGYEYLGEEGAEFNTFKDGSSTDTGSCGKGLIEKSLTIEAKCRFVFHTEGYHTIKIEYYDDNDGSTRAYQVKVDFSRSFWIKAVPTVTFVSPTPDTADPGDTVTLAVNVSYSGDIPANPTGEFIITTGSGELICRTVDLDENGTGECDYTPTQSKTLYAYYFGDENYLEGSGSHRITLNEPAATSTPTITPTATATSTSTEVPFIGTTTTITNAPASAKTGQSITVSVSVEPQSGSGAPPGTVTIDANGEDYCVAILSGGVGSCSITFSSANSGHVITATYNPSDSGYEESSDSQFINVTSDSNPQPTDTDTPG